MSVSQDFEARRRERLKMQHKRRERQRRIQRIVLLIAVAFLAFLLIFNIVKCAKNSPNENTEPIVTQVPYEEEADTKFDPSIPDPQEGRNDYLDIIKASGQTNHAYLTFDHGPSEEVTPAILDVLRLYNVKATFFMNGKDIKDNPYLCTRAIEEGHLVLPLSKSGNADILYADKTTFMDEVEETYNLIAENSPTGEKPVKIYRFLGSSSPNTSYGSEKQRYKDELAEEGYYYCDWNTTVGDSNTSRSAEQLLNYYKRNKPDLNNLVIQLNNKEGNDATPEMLGGLIKSLIDDGYTISRLDEIEFINEIVFEDEEAKPEEGVDSDSDDDEKPKATKKPSNTNNDDEPTAKPTKKPSSTPEATKTPTAKPTQKATAKPVEETPKPTAKPTSKPTVTAPPATATLAPTTDSDAAGSIDAE